MNKYNIEVGDEIRDSDNIGTKVEQVFADGISFFKDTSMLYKWANVNSYIDSGYFKLTKMNKKIIGYTLLKDTPEHKQGTKFIYNPQEDVYLPDGDTSSDTEYQPKYVVNKPEWFFPIYEEVKPTEVIVDTLAGKVKVTKKALYIVNNPIHEFIELADFDYLIQLISRKSYNLLRDVKYEVKVETFKVGCKTFHIKDLDTISEALKQVS